MPGKDARLPVRHLRKPMGAIYAAPHPSRRLLAVACSRPPRFLGGRLCLCLTPGPAASSLYQDAIHQDIPVGSPRAKPVKLRGRLLRPPVIASRDALLRLDALLARPRSTGLLQEHAVHACAVCAARLLASRTVFACCRCGIANCREFESLRRIHAVRHRVLSRAASTSRQPHTTSNLIAPSVKSGSARSRG